MMTMEEMNFNPATEEAAPSQKKSPKGRRATRTLEDRKELLERLDDLVKDGLTIGSACKRLGLRRNDVYNFRKAVGGKKRGRKAQAKLRGKIKVVTRTMRAPSLPKVLPTETRTTTLYPTQHDKVSLLVQDNPNLWVRGTPSEIAEVIRALRNRPMSLQ